MQNAHFAEQRVRAQRVLPSQDLSRIALLRRRLWAPEQAEQLAEQMTQLLRTPNGQMRLKPIQAITLFELCEQGGAFAPLSVGSGKTLCSLLAPVVLQRTRGIGFRPMLIVPAALVKKTKREMRQYAEHFQIAQFMKITSYQKLGVVSGAKELENFQPDLIICDEGHRAKNKDAAVTKRMKRYMQERPQTTMLIMSGTMTKRSVHDYAHLIRWCLPPAETPLPLHWSDLETWGLALDERKDASTRIDPGELIVLCNEEEQKIWNGDAAQMGNPTHAARLAFRRRLVETPGVVATTASSVDASLVINAVKPKHVASCVDDAFKNLRDKWETPDGNTFIEALEMYRHARELALGFFYRWSPAAPKEWLAPRKAWHKYAREILKHSRSLDSELQVRQWVEANDPAGSIEFLQPWLAVRDTFEPNTEAVWIDNGALQCAVDWAYSHKGIIWVEHQCVGERLEREAGIPYYGRKGMTAAGKFIDDHPPDKSLVASIHANKEGRNLQAWCENLFMGIPANGAVCEQTMGRTHREGQEADEVMVDILVSCAEHLEAFEQARRDARYIEATTGQPQKLLLATVNFNSISLYESGPRWKQ